VDTADALWIMIDMSRFTVEGKLIGRICCCKDKANNCIFF
jgi:hypothetical protein